MQKSKQRSEQLDLLRQLTGEWSVGIALKASDDKVVSGCGDMSAVEIEHSGINAEINTQIEGYEDYYENDLWSIDTVSGQVHLYRLTSEGEAHDYSGKWIDDKTLELRWRGTFEDQEMEEHITAKWIDKNQFELKKNNYDKGKKLLETDYVFRRKETTATS